MTDQEKFEKIKNFYIGKKIVFTGKHPWIGETGIVKELKLTHVGWMFEVELDNGYGNAMFGRGDEVKVLL